MPLNTIVDTQPDTKYQNTVKLLVTSLIFCVILYEFTKPLIYRQDLTRSIFKQSPAGLNSEFS